MNEETQPLKDAPEPEEGGAAGAQRELLVLSAGGRLFAVYADESDCVAEGLRPAPLPHAPPSVLGVVCVRSRMRTVLYPPSLYDEPTATGEATATTGEAQSGMGAPPLFVCLRGDEQLALAAERVERLPEHETQPHDADYDDEQADGPLRATLRHHGRTISLLNPSRIFEAAMRGTERRRLRQ